MSESNANGNTVGETETQVGLTAFADTTDIVVENVEHPIYGPLVQGYSAYDLENLSILEREYKIDNLVWSSASVSGTALAVYNFPQALFTIPTIQDKLRTFDLFRAGVEITFRINATDFHYGTLMVAHVPHYDPTDFPNPAAAPYNSGNKLGNIFTASNNKNILISANSRDTVTIKLPYRAPYPWIDLQDWANGIRCLGAIGSVVVYVMNPLRVTNVGSPLLSVSVFARFIQAEASGNTGATRSLSYLTPNLIGNFVPQSSEQRIRSEKESVAGLAASAGRKLAQNILVPMVGGQVRAVAGAVRLLGDVLTTAGFDQPTSTAAPAPMKLIAGSNTSFGKGLDNSNKLALDPENHIDSAATSMEYRQNETSIKNMCMIPTYLGSILFDDSNITDSTILTLPVCPMLSAAQSSTYLTSGAYKFYPGYSAYWSNLFSYWKGSMKYRFHFVGSKFGTARIRIGWYPHSDETVGTGANGTAGDYISKIVDVCGDTTIDFCIPYCQADTWKKAKEMIRFKGSIGQYVNKRKANGVLFVKIVNPPEVPTSTDDSTIYMNIWQAAGEDLEFGKFGMLAPSVTNDSRFVQQCDVAEAFNQTFESLVPAKYTVQQNITMGEHVDDVKTLLHRAYPMPNIARSALPSSKDLVNPLAVTTSTDTCLVSYIAALYGGWRGSVRHKFIIGDATFSTTDLAPYAVSTYTKYTTYDGAPNPAAIVGNFNNDPLAGGGFWVIPRLTPYTEVEVPYYEEVIYCVPALSQPAKNYAGSTQYYANLTPRTTLQISGSLPTTAILLRMFSVGDDFELGMLMAPPALFAVDGG